MPYKHGTKKNQFSVVWSMPKELAHDLTLDNLHTHLHKFEKKLSCKIQATSELLSFPLSAHHLDEYCDHGVCIIADAAHSIHPIAGQGWNLGVNDVKNLYELSKNQKIDIGSDLFCQMYNDKSYHKAFQLFQITDKLNSHFLNSGNIYRSLINIGFGFIEKNQSLKYKITKYAMGV